ncbi:hypothetical protein IFM12276_61360 [Nocardia sputorum]|uniref:Uncharacterized protein n=1 Tax=Nocardia sputorum TaxID=2984338 RepID=A0ABN6UCR5_9NOCA|nr:hypothetical protein IFM12276_61360 [Nocardia sputorum]
MGTPRSRTGPSESVAVGMLPPFYGAQFCQKSAPWTGSTAQLPLKYLFAVRTAQFGAYFATVASTFACAPIS